MSLKLSIAEGADVHKNFNDIQRERERELRTKRGSQRRVDDRTATLPLRLDQIITFPSCISNAGLYYEGGRKS